MPPCWTGYWRGSIATWSLVHDAGDHEIVIGRVRGVGLGPEGGLPLLYYRGEYRRMDPGSR